MSTALKKPIETSVAIDEIADVPAGKARERSLRFSLYDGFFYSLMVGFSETYFSAFAVFIGSNNFQLAMLAVLPQFCGGLSQFFTLRILDVMGSRQKMVCLFAAIQGLFLVPIAFSYFCGGIKAEVFLLAVIGYYVSGQVVGPVWNSWIGDLVPSSQRGSFFGQRNRMVTVGAFLSMAVAGFILREFEKTPREFYGFLAIFCLGVIARLISVRFLALKAEPHYIGTKSDYDELFQFLKSIRKRNEGRLILYMAAVNFSVFISAAFVVPYLLKTLGLSYAAFVVLTSTVALAKVLSSGFWGELVEALGSRHVVKICGALLPLSILPWAFTTDVYLLFFCQMAAGFIWAGYELSTFTFLLDAVRPADRAKVASYNNFISFTAALVGGVVGTLIVTFGPHWFHEYALVFVASGACRLLAYFIFVPSINEVRIIAPVKTVDILVKAVGFRHAWGLTNRLVVFKRRQKYK